jgi:hypothetical protein
MLNVSLIGLLFRSRRLSGLGLALAFPSQQKYQSDPGTNGAVGDVECRKAKLSSPALLQVEIEEIYHLLAEEPVNEVAKDSTKDEAKGDLPQQGAGVKMVPAEIQDNECYSSHDRQEMVVAAEKAPSGSSVAPVNQLEESIYNHFFLWTGQEPQHQSLRQLVQANHQQTDQRDAPIGGPQARFQ